MTQKIVFVLILSFAYFIAGALQPQAVLLDVPFGVGFYLAESLGWWHPGPAWVAENRLLSLLCLLVFPFVVSLAFGGATAAATYNLWHTRCGRSEMYAVFFVLTLFAFILSVRAEPGIVHVSYLGHWAENY